MKETINISLSGIAFNIETEGYNKLNNYFTSIKNDYDNPAEIEELLSDIEARITEIILSHQSAKMPVSETLVDEIIAQLGFPIDEQQSKQSKQSKQSQKKETVADSTKRIMSKRLYRNPKDAMLGGICGGIATYFKIDPVAVRVIFILISVLSFGLGAFTAGISIFSINLTMIILYLALWIIVPKARTPRQFLEMQGEPITKENMERFLKDEMIGVDINISRITRSEKSATLLSSIFYVIGRIVKFVLYIIGLFIILGICSAIIAIVGFAIYGFTMCDVYFSNFLYGDICLNVITVIIIGIIPLLMLLFALIRPVFKINPHKLFFIVLWVLWIIAIIYGTFVTLKTIERYKCREKVSDSVVMNIKGGKLYVKNLDSDLKGYSVSNNLYIDEEMVVENDIYIDRCRRHQLSDSTVRITFESTVFGNTRRIASQKLENYKIEYRIEGDTLFVNNFTKLNSSDDILNSNRIMIHKPAHLKQYVESDYNNSDNR